MNTYEIIFCSLLFLLFYTYVGYGIVLIIMVKTKELFIGKLKMDTEEYEPYVTIFVAAYNEKDFISKKVENMFNLDYPKDKLQILFVTDGSNDGSPELLRKYPGITVLHQSERAGKIAAINRASKAINHPIVIYSDANTLLNSLAVKEIVKHYKNPKVGCVSGEKRILKNDKDNASGAGEGIYWKYESLLKSLDSRLYSAVGAAGELFSIRTSLHQEVENDTLLDDFIISLRIAIKGYKIAYEPNAFALEAASFSIKEEMKRKIRISAGGIQSIIRLKSLFNFFKFGILTFQYISHRVLRWTIAPLALLSILPLNLFIIQENSNSFYIVIFYAQLLFIFFGLLGWYFENKQIKIRILFIPFYFIFMNLCVFLGIIRYIRGSQSVLWEKAKRA